MKKLIKELFRKMLSEIDYADGDYIDFNEINLQREYDKLNQELFGGKCQHVNLVWSKRRTAHGHVKASRNIRTGQISISELAMSKFYHITYKHFKDTLAHEMIHVYLLQQNINDKHGSYFVREMNRINGLGKGFKISITNQESLGVSPNIKGRELVFFIFKQDGEILISVMNMNTYKSQGGDLARIFNGAVKAGARKPMMGEFYKSSSTNLLKFPIQRSFMKTIRCSTITEATYEMLVKDAEKVSQFETLGNEGIKWEGLKPDN